MLQAHWVSWPRPSWAGSLVTLAMAALRLAFIPLLLFCNIRYSTVQYSTVQCSTVPEQEGADHAEPLEPEPVAHRLLALGEGAT